MPWDPLGDGGAGPPDPGAQLEHVDGPHDLTEDAHHPGRRMDLGRAELHQRGLAGSVGTEDHPALVLLDRPVDAVQQGGTASLDGDVGELEHGIHVWDLSGASGSVETLDQPTRSHRRRPRLPTLPPWAPSRSPPCSPRGWTRAVQERRGPPTHLADAVRGNDPRHLVSGMSDGTGAERAGAAPAARPALDGPVSLALPAPGDPWAWAGRTSSTSRRSRPAGRRGRRRRAGAVRGRAHGRVAGPSCRPGAVGGRAGDGHRAAYDARGGDATSGRPRRGLVAAGDPRPADEPAPPAEAPAPARVSTAAASRRSSGRSSVSRSWSWPVPAREGRSRRTRSTGGGAPSSTSTAPPAEPSSGRARAARADPSRGG